MLNIFNSPVRRAIVGLALLLLVGATISPFTLSWSALVGIMPFVGMLGIAALGQHIVIQQRGFDLSAAGNMSLTAVILCNGLANNASPAIVALSVVAVTALGALIGLVNGLFVSSLRVPPIVTTIGVNVILLGATLAISRGVPAAAPTALVTFATIKIAGAPVIFVIMLAVAAVLAFLMTESIWGRRFAAVGVNSMAAHAAALPVHAYRIGAYVIAGFLFSLAAVLLAGFLAVPTVYSGSPYMLTTLAAVVVGSNPLNGDRGSVFATVIGAFFLTYLDQLVLSLGFDYSVQNMVQAGIVLAGVAIPELARRVASSVSRVAPERAASDPSVASAVTATGEPVLRFADITKSFGPVQALYRVSLDVHAGEIHAIVGENGAGKSTLINIAAGVLPATEGRVVMAGAEVIGADPAKMRRLGLSVAYQHPALPDDLTVQECFQLVADGFAGRVGAKRAADLLNRIASASISVKPDQRVGNLNIAQKHMVEIGRALASRPRVLVLDEPTEPFQEGDVNSLFELLACLKAEGVAIVYISHRLHEVERLADRISVLRDGQLIDTRRRQDFPHQEIIDSIVGRPLGQVFPAKAAGAGAAAPVLAVRGVCGSRFSDVSLEARPGEIVGLAGVEGQGQREFIRTLAGLMPCRSGAVACRGTGGSALPCCIGPRCGSALRS